MSISKNPVKNIIFEALQNSVPEYVIVHKIDPQNSAIEIDYEKITKHILRLLAKNGYKITKD